MTCTIDDIKRNDILEILKLKHKTDEAMESFVKGNSRTLFSHLKFREMESYDFTASKSINKLFDREISSIEKTLNSIPIDELPLDFQKIVGRPLNITVKNL